MYLSLDESVKKIFRAFPSSFFLSAPCCLFLHLEHSPWPLLLSTSPTGFGAQKKTSREYEDMLFAIFDFLIYVDIY